MVTWHSYFAYLQKANTKLLNARDFKLVSLFSWWISKSKGWSITSKTDYLGCVITIFLIVLWINDSKNRLNLKLIASKHATVSCIPTKIEKNLAVAYIAIQVKIKIKIVNA